MTKIIIIALALLAMSMTVNRCLDSAGKAVSRTELDSILTGALK